MKKNVLVTGCAGFIAKGFIDKYSDKYNIIGIDVKPGNRKDITEYAIDIRNIEQIKSIIDKHNVEIVIHTAAEKSLINCENNKNCAYQINYEATITLAEVCEKKSIKFIFISSDQVFDGKGTDYKEEAPTNAINYYGKLKIMVEERISKIKNCAICRTALVFGSIPAEQRVYFDTVKNDTELAVQGYIVQQTKNCLEKGLKINLPANEFVSPTHTELLARQLDSVIEKNVSGILHCCGKDHISRYEMGQLIAEKYGLEKRYINGADGTNPLRPKDVSLNCFNTEKKLGFEFPSFKVMLEENEYE